MQVWATSTIHNYKQYMKLLYKIYVKLTLQWRSNCWDVKENLKLARELKSISQDSGRPPS